MTEQLVRPKNEDIQNAYNRLFKSSLTLSKIKDAALGGRLLVQSGDALGVVGRSMAWKLFLCPNEPLKTPSDSPPTVSIEAWRSSRKAYVDLLLSKMRAPDGSYEDGLVIPGVASLPKRGQSSAGNLEKNNPLSLHDENPWNSWFASVELRKTILQDVERTFPDLAYFRNREVQSHLTNILFIYSVENPDLGYRQGMHELLAPILYAVDYDSRQDGELDDPTLAEYCSRAWVAADSYALFLAVMNGVGRWYEWREGTKSSLSTHGQARDGRVDLKQYVAPIVEACNRLQSRYLKSVDPDLWRCMETAGIEPQIYGIRWLRLLFTREFSMTDAMVLWDGLFACDPNFDLPPWICVAMLVRIRNRLMYADYSGQLTYLLRYPTPPAPASDTHHVSLLLRQALTLQMAPSLATGAAVVYENRNLLNIPVELPEPPSPTMRRRPVLGDSGRSSSTIDGNGQRKPEHSRTSSASMAELIARGLLDRGESLGINKTVMNAVSELKRNLPDLAASFNLPPPPPSSFQLLDERPPEERPPWQARTRFEVEREAADVKSLQRRLGDSVEWIVDALLQDEEAADPDKLKSVKDKKREALESLAYVRDVLKGRTTDIDDEQLFSLEELQKRRILYGDTHPTKDAPPTAPVSVTVPEQRLRTTRTRPSQESLSTHSSFMPSLNNSRRPSHQSLPRSPPIHGVSSNEQGNAVNVHRPSPPKQNAPRPPSYPPTPAEAAPRKVQHDPLGVI